MIRAKNILSADAHCEDYLLQAHCLGANGELLNGSESFWIDTAISWRQLLRTKMNEEKKTGQKSSRFQLIYSSKKIWSYEEGHLQLFAVMKKPGIMYLRLKHMLVFNHDYGRIRHSNRFHGSFDVFAISRCVHKMVDSFLSLYLCVMDILWSTISSLVSISVHDPVVLDFSIFVLCFFQRLFVKVWIHFGYQVTEHWWLAGFRRPKNNYI